jgi:5-methylcytosine-specific restriction endonuclease McrA
MSYARNAEKKAAQAKARRARDREMYNASVRERRKQHPEKHRAVAANRRQKERTGTITAADIRRQLEAQGFRCYYCFAEIVQYHVDHFRALANGGLNVPSNIVIACALCNQRKGRMDGMRFIRKLNYERWNEDA